MIVHIEKIAKSTPRLAQIPTIDPGLSGVFDMPLGPESEMSD